MRNGFTFQKEVSQVCDVDACVVKVEIKTRRVKVTGPKGEIVKSFRHMPCELSIVK